MANPEPSSLRLAFSADAERGRPNAEPDTEARSASMLAAFDAIRQAILSYEQNLRDAPGPEAHALPELSLQEPAEAGAGLERAESELLRETEARVRAELRTEQVVAARAAAEAAARVAAQTGPKPRRTRAS
ncbi:MAG: hypothetical protein U1F45_14400 [Burkholderiales bacterium]